MTEAVQGSDGDEDGDEDCAAPKNKKYNTKNIEEEEEKEETVPLRRCSRMMDAISRIRMIAGVLFRGERWKLKLERVVRACVFIDNHTRAFVIFTFVRLHSLNTSSTGHPPRLRF